MSLSRQSVARFLMLLWGAGITSSSPTASAAQAPPPTTPPRFRARQPPIRSLRLPTEQETSLAALQANAAKYPPGLLVTGVDKGSPAEQAGLKAGDLLLAMDGVALRFIYQLIPLRDQALWANKQTIMIAVQRGTQRLQLSVTVAPLLGIVSQPLLPDAAAKLYAEAHALTFASQRAQWLAKVKAAAQAAEQAGDIRAAAWLWNAVYWSTQYRFGDKAEVISRTLLLAAKTGDAFLTAASLVELGNFAQHRGKLEEAEQLYRYALTIQEQLAPNSEAVAGSLSNLGDVAHNRGKLEEAEQFHRRALTIDEKIAPDSLDIPDVLSSLGDIAHDRGKLDEAEQLYRRALTFTEKLAPNSLEVAASLNSLGNVAHDRGKLDEAEQLYQRVLTIREKLAPDSLDIAASLNNLGNVARNRGKLEEAEAKYSQAWRIVQRQGRQVAGDSARQEFGQAYSSYAADLLTVQLQGNHREAAFVTLEQGRSQALLQVMAERRLTEKVTPLEVWQRYQDALAKHNAAFKQAEQSMAQVEKARVLLQAQQQQKADAATLQEKEKAVTAAEQALAAKRGEEVRTRDEMESCWAEVRRSAKTAVPEPLDANTVRTHLPTGTLVLEFAVNKQQLTLFAATSEGVKAYILPASREELEAKVKFIRRVVAQDSDDRTAEPVVPNIDVQTDALRTLYAKLFPAEVQVAIHKAKHVVVSPDDFLWDLPFGALVTNPDGAPVYLAQQKPLAYTQSLTLFVQPPRPDSPASDNARGKVPAQVAKACPARMCWSWATRFMTTPAAPTCSPRPITKAKNPNGLRHG